MMPFAPGGEPRRASPQTLSELDKLTVSPADQDGFVTVTGAAGAVPGAAAVFVLSLQTGARARTTADASGKFTVRIAAPDGSALVINHANDRARDWREGGPALVLTANPKPRGSEKEIRFATAGPGGGSYWMAEGVQNGAQYQPGDMIEFTIHFTAPPGVEVSERMQPPRLSLLRLSDAGGRSVQASFVPALMTPTGLPIFSRSGYEGANLPSFQGRVQSVQRDGARAVLTAVYSRRIADDWPVGHYAGKLQWNLPGGRREPPRGLEEFAHGSSAQHLTPVFRIGNAAPPRIPWVLLGNTLANGTRGAIAREDRGAFDFGTKVAFNATTFIVPKDDARGRPVTYRLEPYLPTMSYIMGGPDRPVPPLVNFKFPSGELRVSITQPDGKVVELGKAPFRAAGMKGANERGFGTTSLNTIYELTTLDTRFHYEFPAYGHYVVTMEGWAEDASGTKFPGGGEYDLYVARPLDLDPGTFLSTPFQVGDVMSPVVNVRPLVPADVRIELKLFPDSDAKKVITRTITGRANGHGYFHPGKDSAALALSAPGEYVVDLTASYTDADGVLWMGAMRGASVVETPGTKLVAHGRRGIVSPDHVPNSRPAWFVSRNIDPAGTEERRGTLPQMNYPYFTGDVVWATDGIPSGIFPELSLEDPEGVTKLGRRARGPMAGDMRNAPRDRQEFSSAGRESTVPPQQRAPIDSGASPRGGDNRAASAPPNNAPPMARGPRRFNEPEADGESDVSLPDAGDRLPAVQYPERIKTWAYYYIASQRPGVTVRSFVASGGVQRAYWQFEDPYNAQLGNGGAGDLPDDIKLQYGGIVYRDTEAGVNQYAIYGSMAVMIRKGTARGMRTFPPFQGAAGGPNGGPLLTVRGKDVDLFFTPVGVMPGGVLEVGDTFSFSGAVWPTLPSLVEVQVTTPGGKQISTTGRANKVGHYHKPADDFAVAEPGVYSVNVRVTHDGLTSAGPVEKPFPAGGVLGVEDGAFQFYVVPKNSPLAIDTPAMGASLARASRNAPPRLDPGEASTRPGGGTFAINARVPSGWTAAQAHFTANLTGTVLESGPIPVENGGFTCYYDLRKLRETFANLDPDPADTVVLSLCVTGTGANGKPAAAARTVLFQGSEVLALAPQ